MTAIPEALLKRIEDWCAEHPTGQIVLNVADHRVKTFEFKERGHVQTESRAESPQWTKEHSGLFVDGKVSNHDRESRVEENIREGVRLNYQFPEPPIHKG